MFGSKHSKSPSKVLRKDFQLKSKTQLAALNVMKKEELNGKKKRLEDLLIHQFTVKFGTKSKGSAQNTAIRSEVTKFIQSATDLNEAEAQVPALENSIRDAIDEIDRNNRKRENEQKQQMEMRRIEVDKLSLSAKVDRVPSIEQNQWPVVNAILAVSEEMRREQELRESKQRKQKFQSELDKQRDEQKQREQQSEVEKQRNLEKMKSELNDYEREKLLERERREERFKFEREMRTQQIEERKLIKEEERLQRIAFEKAEMAIAKRRADEEDERKQARKEQERLRQEQLFEENERNKQLKAQQLKAQQDYEKRLNREYEEKLAREEAARQQAFNNRVQALGSIAQKYESGVGAQLQQQKALNESLSLRQQHEREQAEQQRELAKQETRRRNTEEAKQFNLTMAEQHRRDKEQERQDAVDRRRQMELDAQEAQRREREQQDRKRLLLLEQKATLDRQVEQRRNRNKNNVELSDLESNFNRSILDKLSSDPALKRKVAEKLRPDPYKAPQSTRSQIF